MQRGFSTTLDETLSSVIDNEVDSNIDCADMIESEDDEVQEIVSWDSDSKSSSSVDL